MNSKRTQKSLRSPVLREGVREHGFSLLEVAVAGVILLMGIVTVAVSMLSAHASQESFSTRSHVLLGACALIEEIRGSDPAEVKARYEGVTRPVDGVRGALDNGDVLSVAVDAADPKLVFVRIVANWISLSDTNTEEFSFEVYSQYGQCAD